MKFVVTISNMNDTRVTAVIEILKIEFRNNITLSYYMIFIIK